jgi:ethanolamine utilization microcompartment shell protein EutS
MTSRPSKAWLVLAALASAAPAAAAAAPSARFPVRPAGRGPQRLELPPAFLAASARGDLGDLRLRDAGGGEVPYLLVPPPEQAARWLTAQRIRAIAATKTESGAEIDLGSIQTIAGLEVSFRQHGFLKQVRLEGSADGTRYTILAGGEALYDLPLDADACGGGPCGGQLVRRELRFAPARARWLRLVLDDRRSPRLGPPGEARALGILETFSAASIIAAADAAAKAADVTLLRIHLAMALGGKAFVTMTGDVAAVQSAVDAAAQVVGQKGMLVNKVVIPHPRPELLNEMI